MVQHNCWRLKASSMKVPRANTTNMDPGKTFLNDQQNIEHHWIHLKTFPYDKNIQSLISAIIITMRCETEQDLDHVHGYWGMQ